MSCVDSEGVKTEYPDTYELNPGLSPRTVMIRFMVMLHLMGWSYRKIGKLFNRHHEYVRRIVTASGLSKPDQTPRQLGRQDSR
jgi:hypothetical protein